jgi:hypothetical protein
MGVTTLASVNRIGYKTFSINLLTDNNITKSLLNIIINIKKQ